MKLKLEVLTHTHVANKKVHIVFAIICVDVVKSSLKRDVIVWWTWCAVECKTP